jgi:hypothetical protein
LESRKTDNSRELRRERQALRAAAFLSELKLRPLKNPGVFYRNGSPYSGRTERLPVRQAGSDP